MSDVTWILPRSCRNYGSLCSVKFNVPFWPVRHAEGLASPSATFEFRHLIHHCQTYSLGCDSLRLGRTKFNVPLWPVRHAEGLASPSATFEFRHLIHHCQTCSLGCDSLRLGRTTNTQTSTFPEVSKHHVLSTMC